MKKILFILMLVLSFNTINAQETYTINGETLELKTEIEGNLDLLWNIFDGKYRYFLRTSDNTITELTNTKVDGKYEEEYKETLQQATNSSMSVRKVNLTLFSLSEFIDEYNQSVDASYTSQSVRSKAQMRLAVFGGITNSPFVTNVDNAKNPVAGVELEVAEGKESPRHSGYLQARHVFETDDFEYSTTELSLGYRFRAIRSRAFNLFADVKFATVNFFDSKEIVEVDEEFVLVDISETAFDIPFIFGIGADIRVSNSMFVTLGYNQLFAVFLDEHDNFSTDITAGLRFRL